MLLSEHGRSCSSVVVSIADRTATAIALIAGFIKECIMHTLYLSRPVLACYDNDEAPPAGAPVPAPTPGPAPGEPRAISQSELNRILAEDRRKHQAKIDAIGKTLAETLESKNLTARERDSLSAQLEELQRAAAQADAFSMDQFRTVLRPMSRLEEVTDLKTGKGAGQFRVVVDFPDTDESGQPVTHTLSPAETTRRMKELPNLYGNFFRSGVVSGIGSGTGAGSPIAGGGKLDLRKLTQQQYMEIRAKNPELLGLRPKAKSYP
jgi:hypothetical protein